MAEGTELGHYSHDLLKLLPRSAGTFIEVGGANGALAQAFEREVPDCHYWGVELDPSLAALARSHCDETLALDIERAEPAFWQRCTDRRCWIFGDTLEHLRDPWAVLRQVRAVLPPTGVLIASVPNVQHWSVQARLSAGDFRYEASGLLDRTHLRWFTRSTLIEMFLRTGFAVQRCLPRIFDEPARARFLPLIARLAQAAGADPKQALADALPLQYLIVAQPAP